MTDRRARRDRYPEQRRRQAVPYDEDAYAARGGYEPDWDPDEVVATRRRGISPGAIFLVIAVVGSIAYMAYVLTVREATQIPMLASGAVVLAIVFAALAVYCLRTVLRSGVERGRGGWTMLVAIVGGLAAIGAAGFAAGAIILFQLAVPPA
jgi:hypothetical protein